MIGTVFGAEHITDTDFIAAALYYIDNGITYEDLMANNALSIAAANSSEQIVRYCGAMLQALCQPQIRYEGYKRPGTSSGKLGIYAVDHSRNEANINMVGLTENGIVFDPLHYQPFG